MHTKEECTQKTEGRSVLGRGEVAFGTEIGLEKSGQDVGLCSAYGSISLTFIF